MIDTVQKVSSLSLGSGLKSITNEESSSRLGLSEQTPGQMTGMSFASVLGGMATDVMNNLKVAEATSFEGIKGTANTREVVDAVLAAEQSLQTALALRDKIVSAYLDITKMQI